MEKYKKDKVLVEFGQRIQQLRKEKNLSQEKLAELAGLHRTYIGMIERGEKNITIKNIYKLSISLEIPLDVLFHYQYQPYNSIRT